MEEAFINNPFVVGKYLSDKYFCDRSEETEFLRKQILNGRDVALISLDKTEHVPPLKTVKSVQFWS